MPDPQWVPPTTDDEKLGRMDRIACVPLAKRPAHRREPRITADWLPTPPGHRWPLLESPLAFKTDDAGYVGQPATAHRIGPFAWHRALSDSRLKPGPFYSLQFTPDGHFLLARGDRFSMWDLCTGYEIATPLAQKLNFGWWHEISPNGAWVPVITDQGRLQTRKPCLAPVTNSPIERMAPANWRSFFPMVRQ